MWSNFKSRFRICMWAACRQLQPGWVVDDCSCRKNGNHRGLSSVPCLTSRLDTDLLVSCVHYQTWFPLMSCQASASLSQASTNLSIGLGLTLDLDSLCHPILSKHACACFQSTLRISCSLSEDTIVLFGCFWLPSSQSNFLKIEFKSLSHSSCMLCLKV